MRLRTCVAIEVAVGSAVLLALGLSAAWGLGELAQPAASLPVVAAESIAPTRVAPEPRVERRTPEVQAPTAAPSAERRPEALPPAELRTETPAAPAADLAPRPAETESTSDAAFDLARDHAMLAPLRDARLIGAKVNRGGSTISLRFDFEGGGRAAFKPQQTAWQSNPRKEIAAYRIDRLFGFGSVAPAIGRRFPVEDVYAVMAEGSRGLVPRLRDEIITHTDPADPERELVAGVLSWWIPVIANARIDGHDTDSLEGIGTVRRYLRPGATIPADSYDLIRQTSNMLLFDYLIDNIDRWSGSNVKVDGAGRRLFFMDNTMAFTRDHRGHRKGQGYLRRAQTFSRSLVARLRAVTDDELRAALLPGPDAGPFDRLLSEGEIKAVLGRRAAALEYIDELIERHGEAAVLAFP